MSTVVEHVEGYYVFGLCVCQVSVKYFGKGSLWWSWSHINLKLSAHVQMKHVDVKWSQRLLNNENDSQAVHVFYGHIFLFNLSFKTVMNISMLNVHKFVDDKGGKKIDFIFIFWNMYRIFKMWSVHQWYSKQIAHRIKTKLLGFFLLIFFIIIKKA